MRRSPFLAGTLVLTLAACAAAGAAPATPLPNGVAEAVREQVLSDGVRHRYLRDAYGPWAIHVVEVDLRACGVELRTTKAQDRLVGRATTSAMAAQAEDRLGRPVLAAINADFFSFDPPGVPIGAQVLRGEIVKAPANRPAFGLTDEGVPFLAVVTLSGAVRTRHGFTAPIAAVNISPRADAVALFNRFIGDATPGDTAVIELVVRAITAPGLVGDTVRGVVVALDTAAVGTPLPSPAGVVLAGRGRGATFLRAFAAPGDTVSWWVDIGSAPGRVRELVGGFPRLLERGEPVHRGDPAVSDAFGDTRHPRTAIGWRPDGTLLLVTVDGRQPEYSAGMSLTELAELFQRLGATEALNLDGGGSTTMVVRGAVANRPSDVEGERANANAILILGPRPGEC